jgi:hypothetical protein
MWSAAHTLVNFQSKDMFLYMTGWNMTYGARILVQWK